MLAMTLLKIRELLSLLRSPVLDTNHVTTLVETKENSPLVKKVVPKANRVTRLLMTEKLQLDTRVVLNPMPVKILPAKAKPPLPITVVLKARRARMLEERVAMLPLQAIVVLKANRARSSAIRVKLLLAKEVVLEARHAIKLVAMVVILQLEITAVPQTRPVMALRGGRLLLETTVALATSVAFA
jgi:hypothetical protein